MIEAVYFQVAQEIRSRQVQHVLHMAHAIPQDSLPALRLLRTLGAEHVVMLTGDWRDVAATIAGSLGISRACSAARIPWPP